jgi:hypothetical protein
MLSAPLSAPRAISGTVIRASGSTGVPGTLTTRGSRWARFVQTGRRFSTDQPVMPSPKAGRLCMISSWCWSLRASTGTSSRRSSFAS